MSIVPLYKVTLFGRDSQRERVLLELQDMGCMHVIDLPRNGVLKDQVHPLALDLRTALRYLDACPDQRPAAASRPSASASANPGGLSGGRPSVT